MINSSNASGKIVAYQGVQQENDLTFANSINVDNEYCIYYFYLGTISNVPLYTSVSLQYQYDTEVTFSFDKLTSSSLSNSISKSTETIDTGSKTGGFNIGFKQEFSAEAGKLLTKAKATFTATEEMDFHWTKNWGTTTTDSEAVTSSYLTQYSNGYTEKVFFSENAGFKKGHYYRMSFYNVVSAYGVLAYDVKNESYSTTTDFFLESNATTRVWEESVDPVFTYEQRKDLFFDVNQAIAYAESHKVDIGTTGETNAVMSNELKEYTFSAIVKTESTQQGTATFSVTGIPIIYEGAEYIYGNAYYEGNLGGSRFNDVDRLSLLLEDTVALFGGLISWCGSQGDSNESGSAAWDSTYPHNSKELSYLQNNPGDDFEGRETVKITINGICIKVGALSKDAKYYPEMIKSSFSTSIYTENTNQGRVKFDFYDIKVLYDDSVICLWVCLLQRIHGRNTIQ